MLAGLKALHDIKIMHRDIKCANILVTKEGGCKLADFNVSKVINKNGFLQTQTGTPYYASPEVWSDQPYNFKSDIWSLGCVLYEMAAQRPPFKANDMKGLYKKVVSGSYPPLPSRYSSEFKEVIRLMLQPKPNLRPNCEQVLTLPATLHKMSELSTFDENVVCSISNCQISGFEENAADPGSLINTIKLPRSLKQLAERLPKPNYGRKLSQQSSVAALNNNYVKSSAQLPPTQNNQSSKVSRRSSQIKQGEKIVHSAVKSAHHRHMSMVHNTPQ
jgi:NIMA (never in mitosis gene a)-related kinase